MLIHTEIKWLERDKHWEVHAATKSRTKWTNQREKRKQNDSILRYYNRKKKDRDKKKMLCRWVTFWISEFRWFQTRITDRHK